MESTDSEWELMGEGGETKARMRSLLHCHLLPFTLHSKVLSLLILSTLDQPYPPTIHNQLMLPLLLTSQSVLHSRTPSNACLWKCADAHPVGAHFWNLWPCWFDNWRGVRWSQIFLLIHGYVWRTCQGVMRLHIHHHNNISSRSTSIDFTASDLYGKNYIFRKIIN